MSFRLVVVVGCVLAIAVWLVRQLVDPTNPDRPRTLGRWVIAVALLACALVATAGLLWAMTDTRNEA